MRSVCYSGRFLGSLAKEYEMERIKRLKYISAFFLMPY